MAISGTTYSKYEVQVGIAQESTFGTAVADAGAFIQIPDFESVTIDRGLIMRDRPTFRGKRLLYSGDVEQSSESGGIRTITLSGVRARRTDLPEFLYAVIQNVSEGATTPYSKTFTVADTSPDFTSNEGYFCTIGIKFPTASSGLKFTSCVGRSITLRSDLIGGDGLLYFDITFISGFAMSRDVNLSGTWTAATTTNWNMFGLLLKQVDSQDVVVYSFELTIDNKAFRIGQGTNGVCESYALGVPMFEINGNIVVRYDDNIAGNDVWGLGGATAIIEWGNESDGLADAAGDIIFDINQALFDQPQHGGDNDLTVTLPFRGVYNDAGATPEIRIADAVDQGW